MTTIGDSLVGLLTGYHDLFTDLGMLSRVDTSDGPRWHRPQAMGA